MKELKKYTDEELFNDLKGDTKTKDQAFSEIYNRYSRNIYAYCLKVIGTSHEAEDIYQEVFVRFYKHAPKYEYINLNSLLIKIARNLCLNAKRNKKKNSDIEIDDLNIISPEYHSIERDEMQKLVTIAIDLLEPKYKEPLVLKVYNGLRYEEIGEILDINTVSARTRVFRAKKKMKEFLKPYIEEIYS